MCFCARFNDFGGFLVEFGGSIDAVKLVHLSGLVNCNIYLKDAWSKWGCRLEWHEICVVITSASNTILLPEGGSSEYSIPGYGANSSEIVFSDFLNPLHLSSGQELRLWHLHDLQNLYESDNWRKNMR